MKHITTETINVTTPEGAPVIILELRRGGPDTTLYLRIRMDVPEVFGLIEALKIATGNVQLNTPTPVEAMKAALRNE